MKRAIIIILGLTTAVGGGILYSQQPFAAPQPAAPPPQATKVGIVNMLQLYNKCERVKTLKTQMENEVKPFTKKKEELEKLYNLWQVAFKNTNPGLKPEEREQGQKICVECVRQREDLEFKFKTEVAKRFEQDTEKLTKYIDDSVKYYSAQRGFHLVLAYGEPDPPLPIATGFTRFIAAMDRGYVRPTFFYPGSIDITQDLVNMLNAPR